MAQSLLRPLFPTLAAGASGTRTASTHALPLRTALLLACAVAIGAAAWAGDPSGYLQADPALARLLRGMALIKGMIAIGAVAAVYWRLAWPVHRLVAATYLITASVLAGSTMLIWQLSYIVLAAVLFHLAALTMLIVGWRERA
jgi:hypothetical protein